MKQIEKFRNIIVTTLRDKVDVAVIGTSGGADSTLTSCLCQEALGKENVYAVSMPYNQIDKDTFNNRSGRLADKLGVNKLVVPISAIADSINSAVSDALNKNLEKLTAGNSRSRSRMTVLYGVANTLSQNIKKRIRVIGTGNLSEDFIGYDTKGGDALADIFPIGHLYKSEVYQMLELYKNEGVIDEDLIDRVPSAGLWDGQTDEKELGYSYDELQDAIDFVRSNLHHLKQEDLNETQSFVYQRHLTNKHKHEAPPVVELR